MSEGRGLGERRGSEGGAPRKGRRAAAPAKSQWAHRIGAAVTRVRAVSTWRCGV
jgi:hypothetical protein